MYSLNYIKKLTRIIGYKNLLLALCLGLIIGFNIFALKDLLIYGNVTYSHDNFFWKLPIYVNFYRNFEVLSPYQFWNFFSHNGENFFTSYFQLRLYDPPTFVVACIAKYYDLSTILAFNWDKYIKLLIQSLGVFFLFGLFTKNEFIKIFIFTISLFGSITYISFVQNGLTDIFYLAPLFLYAIFKTINEEKLTFCRSIIIILSLGLSLQSYFYSGLICLFLIVIIWLFIYDRNLFKKIFSNKKNLFHLAFIAIGIIICVLPFLFYYIYELPDLFIISRYTDLNQNLGGPQSLFHYFDLATNTHKLPEYDKFILTGTNANIYSFLTLFTGLEYYKNPGEIYLYFGYLSFILFLFGFVFFWNKYDLFWKIILCFFILLSLGSNGYIQEIIYKSFPIIIPARHTHVFLSFSSLAIFYFIVRSLNFFFLIKNNDIKIILIMYLGIFLLSLSTVKFMEVLDTKSYFIKNQSLINYINDNIKNEDVNFFKKIISSNSFSADHNSGFMRYPELITNNLTYIDPCGHFECYKKNIKTIDESFKFGILNSFSAPLTYLKIINENKINFPKYHMPIAYLNCNFNGDNHLIDLDLKKIKLKKDSVKINVQTQYNQCNLIFNNNYQKNWLATNNGISSIIKKNDQNLMEINLQKGENNIHLIYEPRLMKSVLYIRLMFCLLLILMLPFWYFRQDVFIKNRPTKKI